MADPQFAEIEACVFDAYGTLFDFHSAANRSRDKLGDKADALSDTWRQKQLQYTWLRSLMGRHTDFWEITGDALDYAMASAGLDDLALRAELMQQYLTVDAYPEVEDMLRTIKAGGRKTAVLSNGSPTMLVSAVKSANLGGLLDAVLSVESVGIFKPHPTVYQLAVDQLKVPATAICFQSSNAWDAYAGAAFGFRVAWVNRFGQPAEHLPVTPHAELTSLAELPALLGL